MEAEVLPVILLFAVVVLIRVPAHAHLALDHDLKHVTGIEMQEFKTKFRKLYDLDSKCLRIGRTGGKGSLVLSPWFILYFQ